MKPIVPFLKASIFLIASLTWLLSHTGTASAQCLVSANFEAVVSCTVNGQVQFNNLSTALPGGTIDYYEWDFGDGNGSGATNPMHTYASQGVYFAKLTVYEVSGCSRIALKAVLIFPPPTASFTFSPNNQCSNVPIQFNGIASTGTGLNYTWDFGDGTVVTNGFPIATHTFNTRNNAACDNTQTYTVNLIVTDINGCTSSVSHTVTVKRIPEPTLYDVSGYNFSNCHNNPDPDNPNDTLVVNNTTINMSCVDSMAIIWGDGSATHGILSGDFPITHIYDSLGVFFLNFIAYGTNGCAADTTYLVANQANPNVGLSALGPNTGCAPFEMIMRLENYHMNTPGTTYTWDFGDGTPTVTWSYNQPFINDTITHIYYTSHCDYGLEHFTVSVSAENTCETAVMEYPNVRVYLAPIADFEVDSGACLNEPVHFINTSQNGYAAACDTMTTYTWNFGDGSPISHATHPSHTYTVPGTYNVTLLACNTRCGCTDTTKQITITGVHPDFSFTIPCFGDPSNFFDLSYAYDDSTYNPNPAIKVSDWVWDFGDGTVITGVQNPTHTFATPDTFLVSLTVTNEFGCDSTISQWVWVINIGVDFINKTDVTCYGYSDGTITILGSGSNDTLFYTLFPPGITNTTGFFGNLSAGAYYVRINDTLCDINSDTIWINEPEPIQIDSVRVNHITCHDDNDGEILIYASGGTGLIYDLYTDSIAGVPVTTNDGIYQNLGEGAYYAVVRDANDCPPDTIGPLFVINPPDMFIDSLSSTGNSCFGLDEGTISVFASGGIPPYNFVLIPDSIANTTGLFTNLANGTYTVNVIDDHGCILSTLPIDITSAPEITFDTLHTDITCFGDNDGTITVLNSAGGAAPGTYEISIDGGFSWQPIGFFPNLGPGFYNVMVRDSVHCESSIVVIEVKEPLLLEISNFNTVPPSCHGCLDGQITAIVNGGTVPYSHSWSNGMSGNPITVGAGTYTDTVTDAHGCITLNTVLLGEPDSLILLLSADDVNCYGHATGWAAASVSGGTTPYTYAWTKIPNPAVIGTNDTLFNVIAGLYAITVIDSYSNFVQDTIQIHQPDSGLVLALTYTDTVCYEEITGWAKVVVSGGTPPYSYLWGGSIVATTDSIANLGPGIYTITVTDALDCIEVKSLTIYENPYMEVEAFINPQEICSNFSAQLSSAPMGGTPPYSYIWFPAANLDDPFAQNPVATPIASTTYYVQITDARDCIAMDSVDIIVNPSPDANFTFSNPCASNIVYFTDQSIPNGDSLFTWHWNFGDGNSSILRNPEHFYSTLDTTYSVELIVQNINGCEDTIVKSVYVNPMLGLDIVADSACIGDLTNFSYTVTNFLTQIDSCYWNFGDGYYSTLHNPTHAYALPGLYNVYLIVLDSSGCEEATNKIVLVNSLPVAYFADSTSCVDNMTYFTDLSIPAASGLSGWLWDFGDGTTSNQQHPAHLYPAAGPYTVTLTVTNSNSCEHTYTRDIMVILRPIADFIADTACRDEMIFFFDQSYTTHGFINSWYWEFGDGGTSVLQNPAHNYAAAGLYNVSLVVTNNLGCYDTVIQALPVYELPESSFSAPAVCESNTTQFTDLSVANAASIQSWFWEFGDGYTSNQQHPSHTFPGTGTYNVLLQVMNSLGCVDDTTIQVMVDSLPDPDFSYDMPTCINDTCHFSDLSRPNGGNILSWHWDFGDGNTSVIQHPYHIYGNSGIFNVELIVTNANGCSDTATKALLIHPQPEANYTYDTACVGQTTYFYDLSNTQTGQIIGWYWEFDDPPSGANNISLIQHPSHMFSSAGVYNVMLIVTNTTYCEDTILRQVVINDPPLADFNYGYVCLDDTAVFHDLTSLASAPIANWHWDFGDGTIITYNSYQDPVTHVYTQSGSYIVTLTVIDSNSCIDSESKIVIAHPLPIPLFDYTQICANNPTHFTDFSSGAGANIISWSWDFGDPITGVNNYSTLQHPLHQFSSADTFLVTLTIINGNGCTASASLPVEILPGPVAAFTADSVCVGSETNFVDLSYAINDLIVSWYWDFGDGFNSTSQNTSHTYVTAGTYFVSLTVTTQQGCMDYITRPMEVHDLPVADFDYMEPNCAGDSTFFMDLSFSIGSNIIDTWNWDFGDGGNSFDQNPVHKYTAPGLYNVILIVYDTNGCTNFMIKSVWVNPRPMAEFTHYITNCDTVSFKDGSFGVNDSIAAWSWDFGDPASGWANYSNLQDPMHVFYGADTFNVNLIITDSHGCMDTVDHLVTLNKPVADFAWDTACVNGGTQFIDLSYAAGSVVTQWSWDFDDGTTSSAANPVHSYTAPGWYNVVLTVTSQAGCVSNIMREVYVHPLPMPDFFADTACAFNETHFTDMSLPMGGIVSHYWDFGEPASGNNTSTLANPTHMYLSTGVFNVTLVVMDVNGCEHYTVKPVYVSPEPNVNFTFADNQCAEVTVYFDDLSSTSTGYIKQWIWYFGDNTPNDTINYPNQPNTYHVYQNGGNYVVMLRVITSNDCESTLIKNIHIIQNPLADFFTENACEDVYINFWDISHGNGGGDIIGWYWDFGDPLSGANNNSFVQNPLHIFSLPGTYTVTQVVTNGNYCTDTMYRDITIYETPEVDFYANPACHLTPTQFFVDLTVTNASTITSFDWDFGDGSYSTLVNPEHTYDMPGAYDVSLAVEDTSGCENYIIHQINVWELPVANFDVLGNMCASDSAYFQDFSMANHGMIEYWIWDFNDGSAPQMIQFPQNPNVYHHFDQTGIYGVTLTVFSTDSCGHSFTRNVEILAEPVADFQSSASCAGLPVEFADYSTAGGPGALTNWYWDFGDPGSGLANNSTQQNPEHTYAYGDSTYNVLLIVENTNNCYDTIVKQVYVNPIPPVDYIYDAACADTLTQFYPDSSVVNIASVVNWEWDFGDGTYAYSPAPTHMYQTAGTYTVLLTITDVNGCENTISHDVAIAPLPVAQFTAPSNTCMGAPVFFDDNSTTSSGYILSYYWDFGDGSDTTINFPGNPDISHIYAQSGAYQVSLQVTTSENCQNYSDQTVNIDLAPIADFDKEGECADFPVEFYDMSVPNGGGYIVAWNWDFGDPASGINNQSILQNPEHQYSAAGIYNVSLIIFNAEGCGDTIVQTVEVSPPAPVDYTHEGHCHADTTFFYIDETVTDLGAITSFTWDFGDGSPTSSAMNPTHIYDLIGYYEAEVTITDTNGCVNSMMHPVEITARPVANFTYEFTCVEDVTIFNDNSTINGGDPIDSWYWDFGDPASGAANYSTLQDPEHDYLDPGMYNVMLIVSSANGCHDSLEMSLEIIPAPVSGFTYEVNPCESGLVYFTDSSFAIQGELISWLWTFEPGHYSTDPDPLYVFSQADTCYTVTLEVEDESGCTGTIEKTVCVPMGLQVDINNSQACLNEPMEFDAFISSPLGDSIVDYLWKFGDPMNPNVTSTLPDPSYVYSIPGTFTVSLEATDKFGCQTIIYDQVEVDQLPIPDFSFETSLCDSNFYFTDMSSGAGAGIVTWKWNFDDGSDPVVIQAPNSPDIVHLYSDLGTYNVTLIVTNANGCTDTINKPVTRGPCVMSNFTLLDTLCCQGSIVVFVDSSTMHDHIYLYEWDFDDGTDTVYTQEAHVVLHKFEEARNYKVRLVIHANVNEVEFKDTTVKIVRVKTRPEPDFVCADACLGDWSVFTDESFTAMGYLKSWSWEFGDHFQQSTSSLENPAYQYSETGEYVVQLIVRNTYGCIDSVKKIVNVNALPEADFSFESVCLGDPTHFWDQSNPVDGNIAYWKWNFGDTLSEADTSKIKNPYYTYEQLGEHKVELLVANDKGCLDIIEKNVEVHPNPLSQFDITPDYQGQQGIILAEEEALGADGFEWDWGDGTVTWGNEMPLLHDYEEDGEYTIQLIVWNEYGCVDTSFHDYEFMFKALYVPNAFAPVGNNQKVKLFKPVGRGLKIYICEVFDTWGNRLWYSELLDGDGRPMEGWDGTFRNKQMPTDVYIWRIKAVFRDGTVWDGTSVGQIQGLQREQQGTVTLIR